MVIEQLRDIRYAIKHGAKGFINWMWSSSDVPLNWWRANQRNYAVLGYYMNTNLYNISNKTVKQTVDTLGPESPQNKMFNFSAVVGFNWKGYTVAVSWGLYVAAMSIPSVSVPVVTPCSVPLVQVNSCQRLSGWLSLSNQQWKQIGKRHHSDCSAKQKSKHRLDYQCVTGRFAIWKNLDFGDYAELVHTRYIFATLHFQSLISIVLFTYLSPSISSLH